MTERARVFSEVLREVVSPALTAAGFSFDRSRSYRRVDAARGSVGVINFQLGQRSLEGRFTVNLGWQSSKFAPDLALEKVWTYQCRYQQRIGLLLPPDYPALTRIPLLGFLFGPRDRWWCFSDDAEYTRARLRQVVDILDRHAIPWLDQCERADAAPAGGE